MNEESYERTGLRNGLTIGKKKSLKFYNFIVIKYNLIIDKIYKKRTLIYLENIRQISKIENIVKLDCRWEKLCHYFIVQI